MTTSLTLEGNSLVLQCKYDAGLVAALKSAIPYTDRRFDPTRRAWLVTPTWGQKVATLVTAYLGEMVFVPQVSTTIDSALRTLEIRYLGVTKPRDSCDERSAFGYCDGSWSVLFPESVLVNWFTGLDQAPDSAVTLYGTLGIGRAASEEDVKRAFRRLARQWHPDTCKEPNAGDMFIRIKSAYDVLSDISLRARYDAGLALEASLGRATESVIVSGYRAPLRCGYVLAEGAPGLIFSVTKILAWEDIYNAAGQVLVVSWPRGADKYEERWC